MAVNLTEAPLHRSRRSLDSREGQDGYPCRFPGIGGIPGDIPILLDIWSQNSYAVFCFIKRRRNRALRPEWHYGRDAAL